MCKITKVGTILQFSARVCDVDKLEEFEKDADSLYFALAEKNWQILSNLLWKQSGNDCDQMLQQQFHCFASRNFFPRTCCDKHTKHDERTRFFQRRVLMNRDVMSLLQDVLLI